MLGVYTQQNSPYYWLRYYDKHEPNPTRKRKSINTKIEISPEDRRRIQTRSQGDRVKLQGTAKLRKLVSAFRSGIAERNINMSAGITLRKDLKLSEGFAEFKIERTVPGSKKEIKQRTVDNYEYAVKHMISACGDKLIYKYTEHKDYITLLHYFEERKLSINSRSIYTRALHALWSFFIKQHYSAVNIIDPVESEEKDPEPIPLDELHTIITFLKDSERPHHYQIIAFMLFTGCRPSSAIMQQKEDISFKQKRIMIRNVKTGKRKSKEFYPFPMYGLLRELLEEMNVKEGETGRLFDMFSVVPQNYTWPLSFWKRRIKHLHAGKLISKEYTLKQIRPTMASFLINACKLDIFSVKKLLDHTDIKITDKHYISFNIQNIRKDLEEITLDDFFSAGYSIRKGRKW